MTVIKFMPGWNQKRSSISNDFRVQWDSVSAYMDVARKYSENNKNIKRGTYHG